MCINIKADMSSYSSPVSRKMSTDQTSEMRRGVGGVECVYHIHTHTVSNVWRLHGSLLVLLLLPHLSEVWPSFIGVGGGDGYISGGAWLKWAWPEKLYPNPILSPNAARTPADCSANHPPGVKRYACSASP